MSNKKIIITTLLSLASLCSIAFGCLGINNDKQSNFNSFQNNSPYVKKSIEGEINEDAQLLSVDDLSVSINKSSITSSTQSYSVTFSSQIQTYTNRIRNCFINITDTSFNADEQEQHEKEEDMPHYEGNVYIIQNVRSGNPVYIPKYMRRGSQFFIDIKSISGDVIKEDVKTNITSIYIPIEIETIGEDAFVGLNDDVTIYCEVEERPESWALNWTDCSNIVWGYEYSEEDILQSTHNVYGGGESFGTGHDYFIGFQNSNNYLPLIMKYDVYDTISGQTTTEIVELPINDSRVSIPENDDRLFEGVGSVIGSASYTKNIDLEMPSTMEVLDETIQFYNIYVAQRNPDNSLYEPDLTEEYYVDTRLGYAVKEYISDYIDYSFTLSSSFGGYTSLSLNVDKVEGIYEIIKSSTYESNLTNIMNGSTYIRYRLTNLNSMNYHIIYEHNGELIDTLIPVYSPIPRYIIESDTNNNVSFLIENSTVGEGFDGSNIKYLSLIGLTVSLDLFTSTGSIVSKSATSTRFGVIEVIDDLDNNSPIAYYDGNLVLILTSTIFTILFAIGAIAVFFYLKRKHRNDEFRRVKPKKYIKSVALLWAGTLTTILAIVFIYFRSVPFNNAIVVYNPIDAYVIVFTIASVFFIGYYIRALIIAFKTNRERKRVIKLKLNETSNDDGTN